MTHPTPDHGGGVLAAADLAPRARAEDAIERLDERRLRDEIAVLRAAAEVIGRALARCAR